MSDIFEDPWIAPKNKDKIMRIGIGVGLAIFSITLVLMFVDEQQYEAVWIGMTCDGMIDFSGTSKHHNMQSAGHNAFHKYYADECHGVIEMAMINNTMTNINMTK